MMGFMCERFVGSWDKDYAYLLDALERIRSHDVPQTQGCAVAQRHSPQERIGVLESHSQPMTLPAAEIVGQNDVECIDAGGVRRSRVGEFDPKVGVLVVGGVAHHNGDVGYSARVDCMDERIGVWPTFGGQIPVSARFVAGSAGAGEQYGSRSQQGYQP